jgi:hypothetical protein
METTSFALTCSLVQPSWERTSERLQPWATGHPILYESIHKVLSYLLNHICILLYGSSTDEVQIEISIRINKMTLDNHYSCTEVKDLSWISICQNSQTQTWTNILLAGNLTKLLHTFYFFPNCKCKWFRQVILNAISQTVTPLTIFPLNTVLDSYSLMSHSFAHIKTPGISSVMKYKYTFSIEVFSSSYNYFYII